MALEVLESNANRGAVQSALDTFGAGVTSVDSVEDVTAIGRDRLLIIVQYTA